MIYRTALILVLLVGLTYTAAAAPDKVVQRFPSNRLPNHIIPEHYDLQLDLTSDKADNSVQIQIRVADNFQPSESSHIEPTSSKQNIGSGNLFKKLVTGCFGASFDTVKQNKNFVAERRDFDGEPRLDEITIHNAPDLFIRSAEYQGQDGQRIQVIKIYEDFGKQLVGLKLEKSLTVGQSGKLIIHFLRPKDRNLSVMPEYNRYIAKGAPFPHEAVVLDESYQNGTLIKYKTANLQPIFGRFVFPCFDEPSFRSTISLQLRHDLDWQAKSSTPVEQERKDSQEEKFQVTQFRTTPTKVPVSSLAFVLSEKLSQLEDSSSKPEISIVRIGASNSLEETESMKFAMEIARKAMDSMQQYTGIEYPSGEFSLFAEPNTNTESHTAFGLGFIQEDLLLDIASDPVNVNKKIRLVLQITKAVASQWFLHLIPVKYWNHLWITEGLAQMKAIDMVKEIQPQLPIDWFVQSELLGNALAKDSDLFGNQVVAPVDENLRNVNDINSMKNSLFSIKSAAVIKYLSNIYDDHDEFRDEVRALFKIDENENLDFDKLLSEWSIFAQRGRSLEFSVSTFIRSHGYPALMIGQHPVTGDLEVEQRSFLRPSARRDRETTVGTQVRAKFASKDGQQSEVQQLNSNGPIKVPKWFQFNNENHWFEVWPSHDDVSAYAHVEFTRPLLEGSIKNAVTNRLMHPRRRLAILEDLVNRYLVRGISYDAIKSTLSWFVQEDHPVVLEKLIYIEQVFQEDRHLNDTGPLEMLKRYAESQPDVFLVKREQIDSLELQSIEKILTYLVTDGHESTLQKALEVFDEMNQNEEMDILKRPVFMAVIRAGSQEQKERLIERLSQTSDKRSEQMLLIDLLFVVSDLQKQTQQQQQDEETTTTNLKSIFALLHDNTLLRPCEKQAAVDRVRRYSIQQLRDLLRPKKAKGDLKKVVRFDTEANVYYEPEES